MSLARFKVLSFDVVGTLIDFERGIVDYVRAHAPQLRAGDAAILDAYQTSRGSAEAGLFPDDLLRVWHHLAAAIGVPDDEGLAEGFRDSVRDWPPFPDSSEALARLHRRFRLVAMTNARRWALSHFERALGHPFDDTVTVDEAGVDKPDPKFFRFTLDRLRMGGYALRDVLHVAQSQYHDIGVARELGYTVCWIERRKGQPGSGGTLKSATITRPDYHYATLAELADAVDIAAGESAS